MFYPCLPLGALGDQRPLALTQGGPGLGAADRTAATGAARGPQGLVAAPAPGRAVWEQIPQGPGGLGRDGHSGSPGQDRALVIFVAFTPNICTSLHTDTQICTHVDTHGHVCTHTAFLADLSNIDTSSLEGPRPASWPVPPVPGVLCWGAGLALPCPEVV